MNDRNGDNDSNRHGQNLNVHEYDNNLNANNILNETYNSNLNDKTIFNISLALWSIPMTSSKISNCKQQQQQSWKTKIFPRMKQFYYYREQIKKTQSNR